MRKSRQKAEARAAEAWKQFAQGKMNGGIEGTRALSLAQIRNMQRRAAARDLVRMSGRDWADLFELFMLRIVAIALLCFLLAFAEMSAPVQYLRCWVTAEPGVLDCAYEAYYEW